MGSKIVLTIQFSGYQLLLHGAWHPPPAVLVEDTMLRAKGQSRKQKSQHVRAVHRVARSIRKEALDFALRNLRGDMGNEKDVDTLLEYVQVRTADLLGWKTTEKLRDAPVQGPIPHSRERIQWRVSGCEEIYSSRHSIC
jgi:hypothetical protein